MLPSSIEWTALEYEYHPKSTDWFWALGIIAVAGIIASILFKNYLFAIFIVIATLCLGYFGTRPPEIVEFSLNKKGVRIKDRVFPYRNTKAFWIDYNAEHPQLILMSDRAIMPQLIIPLSRDISPDILREYLQQYMPEEEMKESVSHKVMEYFGF